MNRSFTAVARSGALGIATILAAAGCSSSSDSSTTAQGTTAGPTATPPPATSPSPPAASPPASLGPLSISISSGDLLPAFSPDVHDYDALGYTTLTPVSLTVKGAVKASALGVDLSDGQPHVIPPTPIAAGGTIAVAVVGADGATQTYTLRVPPQDFPSFTVSSNDPAPGEIFISPFGLLTKLAPAYLMILSETGAPLQYTRLPNDDGAYDFKRQILEDGTTRYTYLFDGDEYILDDAFKLVQKVRMIPTAAHPTDSPDPHDFWMLSPTHFIFLSSFIEPATNIPDAVPHTDGVKVKGSVIEEVEDGAVTFEWDSTDHPELYALATSGNDFTNLTQPQDYSHVNSIEIDPNDHNFVVSFRHLDSILKISRTDGTILWRLGNTGDTFNTTAEQKPSHQHFARFLPDGRLSVFDNGNASGATRVLRYRLDEDSSTVTSFEAIPVGYYTSAMGSDVDVGANSLFLGLGVHAPGTPDLLEIDRTTGEHKFELRFPVGTVSYRAFKYDP